MSQDTYVSISLSSLPFSDKFEVSSDHSAETNGIPSCFAIMCKNVDVAVVNHIVWVGFLYEKLLYPVVCLYILQ